MTAIEVNNAPCSRSVAGLLWQTTSQNSTSPQTKPADWFREALQENRIRAYILGRKARKIPDKHDKRRYKRRNRVEIMFGGLKDWRRVATSYDRCPKEFLYVIAWPLQCCSGYES